MDNVIEVLALMDIPDSLNHLSVYTVVLWFLFLVLLVGLIVKIVRSVAAILRPFTQMVTDWRGEPERPGFDEVPGVPARIRKIESSVSQHSAQVELLVEATKGLPELTEAVAEIQKNVKPNGGSSAYDHLLRRIEELSQQISGQSQTPPAQPQTPQS